MVSVCQSVMTLVILSVVSFLCNDVMTQLGS
jgi:hypothetical protein